MKEIPKSLPVAMHEFDTKLKLLINDTKMPFCVIQAVLKDVYMEVKGMADKEIQVEVARYNEAMKNNEKTGSE